MTPAEDFFWTRLSAHGAAPALVMPSGDMVTYAELAARADAFGAQLPAERRKVFANPWLFRIVDTGS